MANVQPQSISEKVLAKGDALIAELESAKDSLPEQGDAIDEAISGVQQAVGNAVVAISDAEEAA